MEAADGGTLFLDEINTMGLALQAKLLKAIEDGVITRVGDVEPIPVNVRIIAASNQEPLELVEAGSMRSDLYYRLKVVQINLPTLKEREGDLPYLTDYFIRKYNKALGKQILGLSREAEMFFQSYDWPGNVRELKNTIEGCFNFVTGTLIRMEDISWYDEANENGGVEKPVLKGTLKETVKAYEKRLIEEALSRSDNLSQATDLLGITRQNLNNKIREYGLTLAGPVITE
jgi:arginine utilization regulatory protein